MTGTQQTNLVSRLAEEHAFGVNDRLGRAMGLKVFFSEYDMVAFVPTEGSYRVGSSTPEGHYFSFETQVTRDGKDHQASHRSPRFATREERDAAAKKSADASRKRALSPAARTRA